MHRLTVLALIALTTGCAADGVTMDLQGTIFSDARGVAVQDDGARVHMGMDWGTTCAFDIAGEFQQDYDFPTETDAITDARGGEALGTSSQGVHFIGRPMADVLLPMVRDAALTETGAIAVSDLLGACEAHWIDADGVETLSLGDGCGVAELDALGDVAAIGAHAGAMVAHRDGRVTAIPGGDQVAADRALDVVYSGQTGSSGLAATELDGSLLWEVALPGGLVDVRDLGAAGMVVASVEDAAGGELVFLDAHTGEIIDEIPVPSGAQLATSADGTTMAVSGDWETYLYEVDRGTKGAKFYTSPRDAGLEPQPIGD